MTKREKKEKALVAITGASGNLGRVVVPALDKAGFSLRLISRENTSRFSKFQQLKIDLAKASVGEIRNLLRGSQVIVHLAGLVGVDNSKRDLFAVNCDATHKVVEACEKEQIPLIHCSSISVYGHGEKKLNENAPLHPDSVYGESKLAGEKIVTASKLHWIVLRPGMIYGSHFASGFEKVIEMMRRGKMPVIGNGKNKIPLVFERDVAVAVVNSVEKLLQGDKKVISGVFNVVGPEPTQERALRLVSKVFHCPLPRGRISIHLALVYTAFSSAMRKLFGRGSTLSVHNVEQLTWNRNFDATAAQKILGVKFTSLEKGLIEIKRKRFS
ncbi:MAG: NAD-dependent epimerase/dehydratase family protein [Candidatus Micrarchaeota archaeon]